MPVQSRLKRLFNKTKDVAVSVAGQTLASHLLSNYGKVKAFSIDAERKTIAFEIELKGETEATKISIEKYELLREESGTSIIVRNVTTSKEWLTALLKDHIVDLPIRLPGRFNKQIAVLLEQL
jgi:hypothetical protein